jgi:4-hydroxythreonine-4-phosphate dehydrogenase
VVYGDYAVLERVARSTAVSLPDVPVVDFNLREQSSFSGPAIVDMHALEGGDVTAGQVSAQCGKAAGAYIEAAANAAARGEAAGMATAPINKESFRKGGVPFAGHTDMLAAMFECPSVCMMMASEKLCVCLVTAHVAFSDVAGRLSIERVESVIDHARNVMKKLGKEEPVVTVCALNPHAGEHGLFGNEEAAVIIPAIKRAREKGAQVKGPVPPDTAFTTQQMTATDVYVAMYHDQGLIPFKMVSFETGVNVTLGLPIIRTSPDHGTAFDIAWQGQASADSMAQSLLWAAKLATLPPA